MQQAFSKIWILIILIALIAGGILAWQYLRVPEEKTPKDETATWKTYLNDEYGFEVKYPVNITIEETNYGTKFIPQEDGKYTQQPHPAVFLFIHPEEVNSEKSLENLLKEKFCLKEVSGLNLKQEECNVRMNYFADYLENTVIGKNIQGYLIHEQIQAYGECHYFIKEEGALVDIFRGETGLGFSSCMNDPIFNQILSTFQFIKEDETANWKTYGNEEYGFEVKYPDQFSVTETYISEKPPSGISLVSKDKNDFKGRIWIRMFAKNERKSREECINEEQTLLSYEGQKVVNSIVFYHFVNYPEHIGAYCGMSGGCNYKDIYRTFYNDNCYQIEYSRSDREFIEGDVKEVPALFYKILSTFRFIE